MCGIPLVLVLALTAAAAAYVLLYVGAALKSYARWRGMRLVTCPESKRAAAVELDAAHAAVLTALGFPRFRLKDCSRWRERGPCEQPCLRQIEQASEDCLVRQIVTRWYEGKRCAYCRKPVSSVDWLHKPSLRDGRGRTVQWNDVPPENLPEVLATFAPVCWSCHMTETFRRVHPELVLERRLGTGVGVRG